MNPVTIASASATVLVLVALGIAALRVARRHSIYARSKPTSGSAEPSAGEEGYLLFAEALGQWNHRTIFQLDCWLWPAGRPQHAGAAAALIASSDSRSLARLFVSSVEDAALGGATPGVRLNRALPNSRVIVNFPRSSLTLNVGLPEALGTTPRSFGGRGRDPA